MKIELISLILPLITVSLCVHTGFSSDCSIYSYQNFCSYDSCCWSKLIICFNANYTTDDNLSYCNNECETVYVSDLYIPFINSTVLFDTQNSVLGNHGPCLFQLNLTNNHIEYIAEDAFISCSKLTVLNLDSNEITNINFTSNLNTLTELQINNNNLSFIEAFHINQLQYLRLLSIAYNKLISLGNESYILPVLEILLLNNNNLTKIETYHFQNLSSLKILNLASNNLQFVNKEMFSHLNSLENLLLYDNNIEEIVAYTFKELEKLKTLDLQNNKISTLYQESFLGLANLKVLLLDGNHIEEVMAYTFKELKQMNSLYIGRNKISILNQESFFGLANLQILMLNDNQIAEVVAYAFKELNKLERLDLQSNKISVFNQESFYVLPNLQHLLLNNNLIKDIPVGTFKNLLLLGVMQLSNNRLSHFRTGCFSNLKKLKYLDISYNSFSTLNVVALNPIKELELLDLDNNNFVDINYRSLLLYHQNLKFISINNNIWNCHALWSMLDMYKAKKVNYLFKAAAKYNEQNVDGIFCTEEEIKNEKINTLSNSSNNPFPNTESAKVLSRILEYMQSNAKGSNQLINTNNTKINIPNQIFENETSSANVIDILFLILGTTMSVLLLFIVYYMRSFNKLKTTDITMFKETRSGIELLDSVS